MSRSKFYLALLAIFGLGLGLTEAVVRYRAHARYGDYLDIYDFHTPFEDTDILVPLPNLDFQFAGQSHIQTDSRGFRSPELSDTPAAGHLRLAFVGGSTTFCSQASSNQATWPEQVTAGLTSDLPQVHWEYLNAGVTGYRTTHSTTCMLRRVAPLAPSITLIYHGTNDLAVDSKELAVAAGLSSPQATSWLEEHSLLWMLVQKNRHWLASQSSGRSEDGKLELDLPRLRETFRGHLTELVQAAQGSSELVVLISFSAKIRREQAREVQLENLEQSFSFMPYLRPEDILAGYEAYNQVIAEVAQATGALLIDAAAAIPGDSEHFYDSVHLTDAGCQALAKYLVQQLEAFPEVMQLVKDAAEPSEN